MQDDTYRELARKIPREVIRDLLPLYVAGEASEKTAALIEEYLVRDAELRSWVDVERESLARTEAFGTALSPEVELRSLRRTQVLLWWQRQTYGWALALSIASFGGVGSVQQGHFVFHFFLRDYPEIFWPCVSLAVSCWINYLVFRWRLRSTKL